MLKNNKWKLFVSSLIILLPAALGLFFRNELPEQMITHWGLNGKADGWSSLSSVLFTSPLIMLALHWLCILATAKDPKNKDQHPAVFGVIFWIIPFLSLVVNGVTYAVSLGKEFSPFFAAALLMGGFLVCIGNYFPKCKQNHTIGIKIKWALQNEENWNATHRIGGKIWVAGGLLLIVCSFLPQSILSWIFPCVLAIISIVPAVYSWRYHQKQVKEGTAVPFSSSKTKSSVLAAIICTAALVLSFLLIFSGNINVVFEETSFTIEASYWRDLTVEYSDVTTIEYRESDNVGSRTNGLGGGKLLAGSFQNNEFGHYTRYSYTSCEACIVLTCGSQTLVINGPDAESTKAICSILETKIE